MQNERELITVGEAARLVGVSTQRMYQLAEAGRLGQRYLDRYWLFTPDECIAYRDTPKPKGGATMHKRPRLTLVKT